MKNQKGAISIFVVLSMLFLLAIIVGIYTINAKRAQTQTESIELVKDRYYTAGEEERIYEDRVSTETRNIPVSTKEQLWSMRTGKNIEIEGSIYQFTEEATYVLQNDIILNINSDMKEFDDTNLLDSDYEIYYYYSNPTELDRQGYYDLATGGTYDLEVDGEYFVKR